MAFSIQGAGVADRVPISPTADLDVVEEVYPTQSSRVVGVRGEQEVPERTLYEQISAGRAYRNTHQLQRERGPALHAHQIMTTNVMTLRPQTTITEAWRIFRERRFRHVPVVTADRKIYGIISDRDLLRYAAVSGKIPPYDENAPEASSSIDSMVKTRVITATRDTEIRQIARMLFEQRVGVMPIVTDTGMIEGIITRSDILRTLVNHAPLELWV